MIRVFLLRHGRTSANDAWLYCGKTDLPLSETGRAEILELRERYSWPDIGAFRVYTSGLRRTEETLGLLYGSVPHTVETGLREMDFGVFEMYSYEQLKDDPAYREWCSGDNESNTAPGGESGREMTRRVIEAFDKLVTRGDSFMAVCHGGPIAAIMDHVFPEEGKNRFQWQPKNGRGYMLELDENGWRYYSVPEGGDLNVG